MLMQSIPSIICSVPGMGLKFSHSAMMAPVTPVWSLLGIASRSICEVIMGMPSLLTRLACTGNPPSVGIASTIALTEAPA